MIYIIRRIFQNQFPWISIPWISKSYPWIGLCLLIFLGFSYFNQNDQDDKSHLNHANHVNGANHGRSKSSDGSQKLLNSLNEATISKSKGLEDSSQNFLFKASNSQNGFSSLDTYRQSLASEALLKVKKKWEEEFEEGLESLISKVVGPDQVVVRANITFNAKYRDTLEELVDSGFAETTTKIREAAGGIERVSVAILVDGVESPSQSGSPRWVPRPPHELAQLESLVKNAIGFTESRGDSVKIESLPFNKDNGPHNQGLISSWDQRKSSLFKWSLLGASFLLFIFFAIRPLVSWIADSFYDIEGQKDTMKGESPNSKESSQARGKVSSQAISVATDLGGLQESSYEGGAQFFSLNREGSLDPKKVESEKLREQIVDILDRNEEKAVDALNMWLMEKG